MIQDFAASDRTALLCVHKGGQIEIDASNLELGPLVELLSFRQRSLPPDARLKIGGSGSALHAALKAMPDQSAWAFAESGHVGALRVQPDRPSAEDVVTQQKFLLAIRQKLELNGLSLKPAQALTGAAGELIDNIGQHAGENWQALAAYQIDAGSFWLAVGDSGKGVLASYAQMPDICNAQGALRAAVIDHRSSTGDPVRGLGFTKMLRALSAMDASLRVRSDDASLEHEGSAGAGAWVFREQVLLSGFVVSAHVRWQVDRA